MVVAKVIANVLFLTLTYYCLNPIWLKTKTLLVSGSYRHPVSYTHLDVYKRQNQRNSEIGHRSADSHAVDWKA